MAQLDDLLIKTSRTFALSIPMLPYPLRQEVTIAYLIFRIADTFEDADLWPKQKRIDELHRFGQLLQEASSHANEQKAAQWIADRPCEHEGYLELLAATPMVLDALDSLPEDSITQIKAHAMRTIEGMAGFVDRATERDGLQLAGIDDLDEYCYVVAGIVGEMLTELFLLASPSLRKVAPFLREHAEQFGAGLQLVNILKDSADDLTDGRRYVPRNVDPAEVFALARRKLDAAARYVGALQNADAPEGLLAFTALPVLLAWATLDRVEDQGPGAKLTRDEVAQIVLGMHEALEKNQPVVCDISL